MLSNLVQLYGGCTREVFGSAFLYHSHRDLPNVRSIASVCMEASFGQFLSSQLVLIALKVA